MDKILNEENSVRPQAKTKVFISYSRKNMDWADWLVEQLTDHGIEVLIDRQDIVPGEAWEPRIYSLIDQADTVIFLISSASVNSGICHQEVDYAESLNKRFVPLLLEDPINEKGEKVAVPEALQKINYIFFNKGSDPHKSLKGLVQALLVDIHWVREHTRIGELAQRWDQAGQPSSQLLRGKDLEAAEQWRDHPQKDTRPPTELQLRYIAACRKGAGKRRNMLVGSLVAGLVIAVGLGGLAYWQRAVAVQNARQASEELRTTQLTQSRYLTDLANKQLKANDAGTAMLLALEALPDKTSNDPQKKSRPFYFPAHQSLFEANEKLAEIKTYPAWAEKISLSPNGTLLALGSDIYDVQRSKLITSTRGHSEEPLNWVTFSPDGKILATASGRPPQNENFVQHDAGDYTVRLWDTVSGKQILVTENHSYGAISVSFSPNGKKFASLDGLGSIHVWDTLTGKRLGKVEDGMDDGRTNVVYSPNGKILASGRNLWNASTLNKFGDISSFKEEGNSITCISFSPDNKRIAVGSAKGEVVVWKIKASNKTFKISKISSRHIYDDPIKSIVFSHDSEKLTMTSSDKVLKLLEVETLRVIANLSGHNKEVTSVLFFNNDKTLVSSSDDRTIRFWNIGQFAETRVGFDDVIYSKIAALSGHHESVASVAFSPNSQLLASGSWDGELRVWNVSSRKELYKIQKHNGTISKVVFSSDGQILVSASDDKTIRLWDTNSGSEIAVLEGQENKVKSIVFSRDSKSLVSISSDHTIRIWDIASQKLIRQVDNKGGKEFTVAFTDEGLLLAIATEDHTVSIWNENTGEKITEFKSMGIIGTEPGPEALEPGFVFSIDGEFFAGFTDRNNTVTIFNTSKRLEYPKIKLAKNRYLYGVVFSKKNNYLATVSFDTTTDYRVLDKKFHIDLWDVKTGQKLAMIKTEWCNSHTLSFSQDNKSIACGVKDGEIHLWTIRLKQELINYSRNRLPRNLTPSQLKEFKLLN